MADVKWIKIATDIFDDEKILMIESLPNSDSIIVIWFKLLTFAGKQNNHGVFIMNDRIAYTEDMLSAIFRRDLNLVRMALKTFEQYGMIEIIDGTLTIPNWSKHQSLDKIEKNNEYHKKYMREYREKQKLLACKVNSEVNSEINVKHLEKELELELELEKDNTYAPNGTCGAKAPHIDYKLIINEWNKLGLAQITKISTSSNRQRMIKARVKEYGIEKVIEAIHNIARSNFLNGQNDRGWVITFDWFIKPSNFTKVLEGNYTTKTFNSTPINGKVNRFNQMDSHDWDFDEIEELERRRIEQKIKDGEYGGKG